MTAEKNILYAPWRKKYFAREATAKSKTTKDCMFCNVKKIDSDLLILEGNVAYIQANKYPYGTGHIMVIPKRHINSIADLTTLERKEIFNLLDLSVYALDLYLKPDGYNVGCSVGKVAGESVMHFHFHVLPRFEGDIGWTKLSGFDVCSIAPVELSSELKSIISKNKLEKKFDVK